VSKNLAKGPRRGKGTFGNGCGALLKYRIPDRFWGRQAKERTLLVAAIVSPFGAAVAMALNSSASGETRGEGWWIDCAVVRQSG
jgi:hypothetical protein